MPTYINQETLIQFVRNIGRVDKKYLDVVYSFSFLILVASAFYVSRGYDPEARVFPMLVSGTGIVIAVVLIGLQIYELRTGHELGVILHEEPEQSFRKRKKVIRVTAWVLIATVLVYTIGFLIGSFLFISWYYSVETDTSVPRSIAYAFIVVLAAQLFAQFGLGRQLWEGLIHWQIPGTRVFL